MSCCQNKDGMKMQILSVKNQIQMLRRSTSDINFCIQHLNTIRCQLDSLNMSKVSQDKQFYIKHQNAAKIIINLKDQIQKIKQQIREQQSQKDKYGQILRVLKDKLNKIICQIQYIKKQITNSLNNASQINHQCQKLKQSLVRFNQQKNYTFNQLNSIRKDYQILIRRKKQAEHYLRDIQHQNKMLIQRITQLQNQLNNLGTDNSNQQLYQLQNLVQLAADRLRNFQQEYAQINSIYQRMKSQMIYLKGIYQQQIKKGYQIRRTIQQNQILFRQQLRQIQRLKSLASQQQIQQIKRQNIILKQYLNKCKIHIDNLFNQNNQLVSTLENYVSQDQRVKSFIDRRDLSERVRNRYMIHYQQAKRKLDRDYCQNRFHVCNQC